MNTEERQSYYVGIKGIITNAAGDILIFKDAPRDKWELPGGRINKNQSIPESFKREISEEIEGTSLISMGEVLHVAQGDFKQANDHKLLLVFYKVEVALPEKILLSSE